MALTKKLVYDKTEILGDFKSVQCREATIIEEDGVEISRSFNRHVLRPSDYEQNEEDGTYSHVDTDLSGEPQETQDVCNAVWTADVRAAWKTHQENNRNIGK